MKIIFIDYPFVPLATLFARSFGEWPLPKCMVHWSCYVAGRCWNL